MPVDPIQQSAKSMPIDSETHYVYSTIDKEWFNPVTLCMGFTPGEVVLGPHTIHNAKAWFLDHGLNDIFLVLTE